ncbi:MAG: hypothetical protein M3360_08905 [Actinomycetota bacterium]|nr:hypothetical protein [Actinomycetota bacterium]
MPLLTDNPSDRRQPRTLFTSAETLEAAWRALEGVTDDPPPVEPYER